MPSPIELLTDPVTLYILGMYAVIILWEMFFPAKQLPKVSYWKIKGLLSFLTFFYLSSYIPLFIDPFLAGYQLFDLSTLSTFKGTLLGVFIYELAVYIWHYSMHKSNFLWKTFHQMHHSAERMDAVGAFFFSPLDMMGFTLLSSLCFALLIGLSPASITYIILITTFFSIFQHANIKTPVWLGYIIQRPESHSLHHGKGIHKNNYSDLPIFDILFNTFQNPRNHQEENGFYHGASARMKEMLCFKLVDKK